MTETQAPTPAARRFTFHGYLADDNVEQIADRIRNLLEGRRYTFVSTNTALPHTAPEVRTSQRLTPEKTDSKESPRVIRFADDAEHPMAHIVCADTYGVWGIHSTYATEREATDAAHGEHPRRGTYVKIEGGREPGDVGRNSHIQISQYNGVGKGELLHWVIAPEADPAEDDQ